MINAPPPYSDPVPASVLELDYLDRQVQLDTDPKMLFINYTTDKLW